jgi:hypothetical protein
MGMSLSCSAQRTTTQSGPLTLNRSTAIVPSRGSGLWRTRELRSSATSVLQARISAWSLRRGIDCR